MRKWIKQLLCDHAWRPFQTTYAGTAKLKFPFRAVEGQIVDGVNFYIQHEQCALCGKKRKLIDCHPDLGII